MLELEPLLKALLKCLFLWNKQTRKPIPTTRRSPPAAAPAATEEFEEDPPADCSVVCLIPTALVAGPKLLEACEFAALSVMLPVLVLAVNCLTGSVVANVGLVANTVLGCALGLGVVNVCVPALVIPAGTRVGVTAVVEVTAGEKTGCKPFQAQIYRQPVLHLLISTLTCSKLPRRLQDSTCQ